MQQEEQDLAERPSANGSHPPMPVSRYDAPQVRPLTIFLGLMWLLCIGYGLWQGDMLAIIIALVFVLFLGAPALIVFGFGRRSRRIDS